MRDSLVLALLTPAFVVFDAVSIGGISRLTSGRCHLANLSATMMLPTSIQ